MIGGGVGGGLIVSDSAIRKAFVSLLCECRYCTAIDGGGGVVACYNELVG